MRHHSLDGRKGLPPRVVVDGLAVSDRRPCALDERKGFDVMLRLRNAEKESIGVGKPFVFHVELKLVEIIKRRLNSRDGEVFFATAFCTIELLHPAVEIGVLPSLAE